MKENRVNEMLNLQEQARRSDEDLDIAFKIFNYVTNNADEMKLVDGTDPVSMAISEYNLLKNKASVCYRRVKELEKLFKK